jgi:hypothetical protein
MKKIIKNIWLTGIIMSVSCSNSDDNNGPVVFQDVNFTFNFTHHWDGSNVTNSHFNSIQYTNANGEQLSIERLRYLISKITFQNSNGTTVVVDGYNLVDVTNNTNLSYSPNVQIPKGTYTNVSFTFGFDNEDNIDGAYADLNTEIWNVPIMLGGGYHFMQLEGKFIDDMATEVGYQYHAIRAVNNSDPNNLQFQDTFFTVDLGGVTINDNVSFEIKMNIAEWFKNPIQWDLNELHSTLMPNFGAQIMMYQNGQNVFTLGNVI